MKVIKIGRGPDNDVVINDDAVSYYHVQIVYDGTLFKIMDLDSTNGTYVNGYRIANEVQLFLSDTVRIGNTDLPWHQYFAYSPFQPPTPPVISDPPPPPPPPPYYYPPAKKKKMFAASFSFKGRIRRSEYGISCILGCFYMYAVLLVTGLIVANNRYMEVEKVMLIYLALNFPYSWFILAQGTKRCHDRNHSGWYQIIPLYMLWMLFADGDYGRNDYGESPKKNR
jgi:uncharacterized membrane protein YhaH (DUF805 family)